MAQINIELYRPSALINALKRLTEYLRSATRRGELACPNPQQAAKLFLGAVISHYHLHCLMGKPSKTLTEVDMRKHVKAAVEMFLSHFAA
jgi:TetR/AcrR family transcriptional regulator, mexJK operon transcriptional repressor